MSGDAIAAWLASATDEAFAHLTTVGGGDRRPHEIEIWLAARDTTVYFLSGGRHDADWVRNLRGSHA